MNDINNLFQTIMDQLTASSNIRDNIRDELRHELVCYNRLKRQEEIYRSILNSVEEEHKRKLDYFTKLSRFFALVLRDISDMKTHRRTNHISIGYLLNIVQQSLQTSPDDSLAFATDNIVKDTLAAIMDDIVNKINAFDFNYIYFIIGIRKLVFEGTWAQDYGQVLVNMMGDRLNSSREEYTKVLL